MNWEPGVHRRGRTGRFVQARPGDSRYTGELIVGLVLALIVWAILFFWAPVWITAPTLALTVAAVVWLVRRMA